MSPDTLNIQKVLSAVVIAFVMVAPAVLFA